MGKRNSSLVYEARELLTLRFFMSRAFTLIEMLVTVSIIAIMTTFTVVNLGFQRNDRTVQKTAREFYGALQYARNLAVSGKVFKDENGDGALDVPNGYGIFFVLLLSGSEFFYKEQLYGDLYAGTTPKRYDSGTEEFGAGEILDQDISISLYFDNVLIGALGLPQTIFFATPRGDITYYDGISDVSLMVPTVQEIGIEFASIKDPSVKDRVIINSVTGQMYVNENQ